jgi:hypothetical protein
MQNLPNFFYMLLLISGSHPGLNLVYYLFDSAVWGFV